MHVRLGCPQGFDADDAELATAASPCSARRPVVQVAWATDAVVGVDVVHTDTWTFMGQEAEKAERVKIFEGFTVDETMMAGAADGAVFMHCLPAYRGPRSQPGHLLHGPRSWVIRQAHNRMHAARWVLAFLVGVR